MSAKKKYKEKLQEVDEELNLFKVRLMEHHVHFIRDQKNKGYVGDLEYVVEKLKDLNRYLKYEEL